ncbi:unnamed protein product [Meganyctiphanes norvegica]|uniref:Uncharacterized protein n=1 Tax=Meganyctiphanes norvegica TaxID=48144 RepID=A0AAV2QNQ5_MEGNR
MLAKALVLALVLAGVSAADDGKSPTLQDQLYIISGVLGGVALILTIVSIYVTLSLIGVQSEVKKLKAAAGARSHEPMSELTSSPSGYDNPITDNEDYARSAPEDVRRPGPSGVPRSAAAPPRDAAGPPRDYYGRGGAAPPTDPYARPSKDPYARGPPPPRNNYGDRWDLDHKESRIPTTYRAEQHIPLSRPSQSRQPGGRPEYY